ncbi:MAG: DUF5615 family PIN-like protein [Chloroflexota bacterium]
MIANSLPRLFIALYLDADVDKRLAEELRKRGVDAVSAREIGRDLVSDEDQLEYAISQQRAVLTHNSRHWEPLFEEYWNAGKEQFGIIVSEQIPIGETLRRVLKLLDTVTADEMKNNFKNLGEFAER